MENLDLLLSVMENPTRRNILKALVREPHYPFQLSKELGVSQQAVVKNLNILEKNGFVCSRREASDMGPMRTLYETSYEFSLSMDLRGGMFHARVTVPSGDAVGEPGLDGTDANEVRERITEIDDRITELDAERHVLIRKRECLISRAMDSMEGWDYRTRCVAHFMLDNPRSTPEEASERLGMPMNAVESAIEEMTIEKEGR